MAELICIGTSGWNYPGWRKSFYAGIAAKNWLNYCAGQFTGIEVNATFYGLQKHTTFARWRDQTPAGFRFAVKGNRYVTHNKKLKDPAEPLRLKRERSDGLGDKLSAMLWQLPANWHKNLGRLATFAEELSLWQETRHVIEFRHPSWFDDEVANCLSAHRIAVCLSAAADWPLWDRVTTDLVYVRLHGHGRTYASAYDENELARWAERIRDWHGEGRAVHVYFDNDAEGHAPADALQLLALVRDLLPA